MPVMPVSGSITRSPRKLAIPESWACFVNVSGTVRSVSIACALVSGDLIKSPAKSTAWETPRAKGILARASGPEVASSGRIKTPGRRRSSIRSSKPNVSGLYASIDSPSSRAAGMTTSRRLVSKRSEAPRARAVGRPTRSDTIEVGNPCIASPLASRSRISGSKMYSCSASDAGMTFPNSNSRSAIVCPSRDTHRFVTVFPIVSRQLHKVTLPIAHQRLCGAVHQVVVSPVRKSSAFFHHFLRP